MEWGALIGTGELAGVEARHQDDGSWRFNWVQLRKRRSGVLVHDQGEGVEDVPALRRTLGTRGPIALVVTGERVLCRTVPAPFDPVHDLGKVLPNARPEELMISALTNGPDTDVGIIRQQVAGHLLDELERSGLRAVAVFIGPAVGRAWEGLREQGPPPDDGTPVQLGTETVERSCLLAFAAAWQHWFRPLDPTTTPLPHVARAQEEERYHKRYTAGLVVVTTLLVVLLAADVRLRDHVNAQQVRLQDALLQQQHIRAELDSLDAIVRVRKELIGAAGIGQAGGRMRLLDRVGASVPPNVVLHELWLAPATAPVQAGEPFHRDRDRLLIQGHTADPAALPGWIGGLSKIPGVQQARLQSLELDPNEGTPAFRILVDLRWS